MTRVIEVKGNERCDRCGHESRFHRYLGDPKFTRYGSECFVAEARTHGTSLVSGRALQCPCDGFFPRPREERRQK